MKYQQELHYTYNEALAEGRARGLAEGREAGLAEGREAGRQEERANTERERKRAELLEAEVEKLMNQIKELKEQQQF